MDKETKTTAPAPKEEWDARMPPGYLDPEPEAAEVVPMASESAPEPVASESASQPQPQPQRNLPEGAVHLDDAALMDRIKMLAAETISNEANQRTIAEKMLASLPDEPVFTCKHCAHFGRSDANGDVCQFNPPGVDGFPDVDVTVDRCSQFVLGKRGRVLTLNRMPVDGQRQPNPGGGPGRVPKKRV